MKVCVLSSGSKGNATYLEINGTKFLLDVGRNYKYITEQLKQIGIKPKDIDYVIITHEHSDHIAGLKTFVTKTKATIILSEKLFKELRDIKDYPHILICEDNLDINGIKITSIHSSHDAVDARNYVIEYNNQKIGYITDTGYVNRNNFKILKNLDIYLFESNHDIELLTHGPYPAWLKKRVLSDNGHLSNKLASFYLTKLIGDNTKQIVLIHLSEVNNLESIALETINNTFIEHDIKFYNIICARQQERTEVIEI